MKIAAFAEHGHIARLFLLFNLIAAALFLGACKGSSGGIDYSYWRSQFGDPDTGHCCTRAERGGNS